MLACDERITLIKSDGEAYTAVVIEGASWHDKTRLKVEGTGVVYDNAVLIRIPAGAVPSVLPETGDQVIRGVLPEGFIPKSPAELAAYRPRRIMAVGDNRRGRLAHVAVVCK